MLRYLIIRVGALIGVLLAVSVLTFFLMHAIPGGPFDVWETQTAQMIPQELQPSKTFATATLTNPPLSTRPPPDEASTTS